MSEQAVLIFVMLKGGDGDRLLIVETIILVILIPTQLWKWVNMVGNVKNNIVHLIAR